MLADEAEALERGERAPLGSFSGSSERPAGFVDQTQNAQGNVGQRGKHLGQARPLGIVTILVPPAVFGKVKAVFDLPVVANVGLQLARRDPIRGEAGGKIATFTRENCTTGQTHFAINPENDLAMSEVQTLADIVGNLQVEPEPAGFDIEPLFSITSCAGRDCDASAKHSFNASSTSGWLASI
jgi:hypothetical protein